MKRILFVSSYLARNGTEAFMMNVFRNIDKSKYHIDFLIFSREDIAYEEEIKCAGSEIFVVTQRKVSPLLYYKELLSFFKHHKGEYQVIHWCMTSFSSIWPLICAHLYKVPIIICHSHNSDCRGLHNKILHYIFRPIANRLCTYKLACSEKAAYWCFNKRDAIIISNGIDLQKFSFSVQNRNSARKQLKIADSTFVIGHVGRFDPVKNHNFIIEIFIYYLGRNTDAKLLLIGIGALEKAIREKVVSLHLEERVLFLGERNDVNYLMDAMDFFVMPSLFEGLPFVLIEAQAAGLPCLTSNTVDKSVKITPNLYFSSLGDPEKWADTIESIRISYKRGKTDSYIVDSGFSIDSTIARLDNMYCNG